MKLTTPLKIVSVALLALTVSSSVVQAHSGQVYVTCNLNPNGDNFLALRTCGSSKCQMIMKLGPDTFMTSLEPYNVKGWREVVIMKGLQDESYSGPSGWVYEKYTCEVRY